MAQSVRQLIMEEYEKGARSFSVSDFQGADLSDLRIAGSNFTWANMKGANLSKSVVGNGSFNEADLSGANLAWTTLADTSMECANLSNADLTSANLFRANLKGANLKGANLTLADLGGATMPDGKPYTRGMDLSQYGATGAPMDVKGPGVVTPAVGKAARETLSGEICWFCSENRADSASGVKLRLERQSPINRQKYKEEWQQLTIPRCQRCASIRKRDTRENSMIGIAGMLAAAVTFAVIEIISPGSELAACAWGGAVFLILVSLGVFLGLKRRGKLSEEQKTLLNRVTQYDIKTHPLVAQYIKDGFEIKWTKD